MVCYNSAKCGLLPHTGPDNEVRSWTRTKYQRRLVPQGRRAAPRSSGWGKRLALVCGLTALALGGGAMLLTLFLGGKQPPPPVTFSYRDQILTAIDGLAVNRYGTEGFLHRSTGPGVL